MNNLFRRRLKRSMLMLCFSAFLCMCFSLHSETKCLAAEATEQAAVSSSSESNSMDYSSESEARISDSESVISTDNFHYIYKNYLYTYNAKTHSFTKQPVTYTYGVTGIGNHKDLLYKLPDDEYSSFYTGYLMNSQGSMYRYSRGNYAGTTFNEAIPLADGYIYYFKSGKNMGKYTGLFSLDDGHIYYSLKGDIYAVTGWYKMNKYAYFYFDKNHRLLYRYITQNNRIMKDDNENGPYTGNTILLPDDHKLHCVDKQGNISRSEGPNKISNSLIYTVGKHGIVEGKFTITNGVIRYYTYNYNTYKWEAAKNTWKCDDHTATPRTYYFDDRGIATMVCIPFTESTSKLYIYKNGSKTTAPSGVYNVQQPDYVGGTVSAPANPLIYVDSTGIIDRSPENSKLSWRIWKGNLIRVYGNMVTAKVSKTGDTRRYYIYDLNTSKWVLQKDTYLSIPGKYIYFDKTGIGSKVYDIKTAKMYTLKASNKLVPYNYNFARLTPNGYIYYFGKNGSKVTKKGWHTVYNKSSKSKIKVYVGKNGAVTSMFSENSGTYRYYKYNYKTNKWSLVRNAWRTVDKTNFYFDAHGASTKKNAANHRYDNSADDTTAKANNKTTCSHSWKDVYSSEYIPDWIEETYISDSHWFCGCCCTDLSDGVHNIDHATYCGEYYYNSDTMEWRPVGSNYFSNSITINGFIHHKAKTVKHKLYVQCSKCGQIK